jgi:hypothetical protein
MASTQTTRDFRADSPLGKDMLPLRSFGGTEAISQLFEIRAALGFGPRLGWCGWLKTCPLPKSAAAPAGGENDGRA